MHWNWDLRLKAVFATDRQTGPASRAYLCWTPAAKIAFPLAESFLTENFRRKSSGRDR